MRLVVVKPGFTCLKENNLNSVFARFSARGLAKLAAWMANKGQEPGKSSGGMKLMSEETWKQMHAEEKINADIEIGGFR